MAESQGAAKQALKKLEDQLTCAICLDSYKDPKVLHCFHVYCKDCLQQLVVQSDADEREQGGGAGAGGGQGLSLRCPTCRQPTFVSPSTGVSGLQPALHIQHLFELQAALVKARAPKNVPCGKCTRSSRTAVSFCRDCGKFICELCIDIHSEWKEYSEHKIVSMEEMHRSSSRELVPPKGLTQYCTIHQGKELDLYCDTCEELICFHCTIKKHKDHQYDLVSDMFEKHKAEITDSLKPLENHLVTVNKFLEQVRGQSRGLDDQRTLTQATIEQEFRQLREVIEGRKTELVEQLNREVQAKMENLTAQKAELQAVHNRLSGCLSFVKTSLETGNQEEVMKIKEDMMKQIKEIATPLPPESLVPCEEANLKFTASADLAATVMQFGQVYLNEVIAENFFAEGRGLNVAELGERATAVLYVVTNDGRPCTSPVETLICELVSFVTGHKTQCSVQRTEVNCYKVSYQPSHRGRHHLHITVDGVHIRGSPFTVVVRLPVQKLGTPCGTVSDYVKQPWGVATNSRSDVIIADYSGHCISVFNSARARLLSFSSCGSEEHVYHPRGVTVDVNDSILVVDGNHRVIKFTSDGEFVKAVGRKGQSPVEFNCPTGIAVHPQSAKVYVADTDNHRIQILSSDFGFIGEFGCNIDGQCLKCPWGLAFDSTENLYVADSGNHCIQVYTAEGDFLRKFGGEGDRDGELNFPTCVSIDCDNMVYVTEYGNHRVSVFSCDGQFLTAFGTMGSGPGQFNDPRGIVVDRNGYVIVSDCENNIVQFF